MSKKILISGGDGRLATELYEQCEDFWSVWNPLKSKMNVKFKNTIDETIEEFKPDIFIHPAAITRPMKQHVDNPGESISTNIIGTSNVALSCIEHNVKLVYISTDYVYPGIKGDYTEESPLQPINNYAWSKLGGECAVKLCPNHLILRVCMTERPFVHPKALVDSTRSLIYIDEVASIIWKLLDKTGVINVGGPASTCYDFAKKEQPDIGKTYREDINEPVAKDSSMNLFKMRKVLYEN